MHDLVEPILEQLRANQFQTQSDDNNGYQGDTYLDLHEDEMVRRVVRDRPDSPLGQSRSPLDIGDIHDLGYEPVQKDEGPARESRKRRRTDGEPEREDKRQRQESQPVCLILRWSLSFSFSLLLLQ